MPRVTATASTGTAPSGTPDDDVYLRTAEVAALFHVSPKTVSRWAKEGKLPYRRTLGGHRRFPAQTVRALAVGDGNAADAA